MYFFLEQVPRRLIHCSDGILEEYSTDEDEDEEPVPPPVDVVGFNRFVKLYVPEFHESGVC